jgi:transcriptional regulator with GAF, ATPase, and Fis domain
MRDGDYRALYEVARLILAEDDPDRAASLVFHRVLEATGAARGFIVVKDGDGYTQKLDREFDRARVSAEERRFSRTLVRQAIETGAVVELDDPRADPRFGGQESIRALGRGVIVAPLVHDGQVFGAIYLERERVAGLSELVQELAGVAAASLKRALERQALEERRRQLERDLFAQHDFEGIVTQHPRMLAVLKLVAQVADADATVLIRGETGTGKELIARALHANSGRRAKPFVVLHCSALPGTLLESELFGHVKGAFTGAERERAGRIASAGGGTLFLDEVAEIPPEVQVKLLRFLQFGEIQRLGSDRVEKVDVRVVAATHQDLPALIAAGRFRQDLYYRLKVVEVTLPPLRERKSDLPLLIERLLRDKARRGGPRPRLTARAEAALAAHDFPGNVRELAHILESAVLLAPGPEIDVDVLPAEVGGRAGSPAAPPRFERYDQAELERAREAALGEAEQAFLDGLMARAGGNVSQAARESGIHRSQLQRMLARRR